MGFLFVCFMTMLRLGSHNDSENSVFGEKQPRSLHLKNSREMSYCYSSLSSGNGVERRGKGGKIRGGCRLEILMVGGSLVESE